MRKFYIIEEFKHLNPILPKRQTTHSAGYDFSSLERIIIEPSKIEFIKTGLKVEMPKDEVLLVFPRSSLAIKKNITMSNNVGVIDADYYNNEDNEGHIMIPFINYGKEKVVIEKGERVAQGIFVKYGITADDDPVNKHRSGGFGSSDKK
ncbi:MAG: dUTP diphosphatase [Acholeplasmatales bacterium]